MISAATGAVALVIAPLTREHGLDYLIATVILGGRLPGRPRRARRRQADAVRARAGHGRLRQRPGHPDLHGPGARPDRRALAGLPADRRRPRAHGVLPAGHQGRSRPRWSPSSSSPSFTVAAGDRRADRRRQGRAARQPARARPARRAVHPGHADASSPPTRSPWRWSA